MQCYCRRSLTNACDINVSAAIGWVLEAGGYCIQTGHKWKIEGRFGDDQVEEQSPVLVQGSYSGTAGTTVSEVCRCEVAA
jgi:hypothetical protein